MSSSSSTAAPAAADAARACDARETEEVATTVLLPAESLRAVAGGDAVDEALVALLLRAPALLLPRTCRFPIAGAG